MGANVITEKNVLCRTLLHSGNIMAMQLVSLRDGEATVQPFRRETEATIFLASPAVLLPAANITDFLLDDLEMLMQRRNPLRVINDYLASSNLYFPSGAPLTDAILLELQS